MPGQKNATSFTHVSTYQQILVVGFETYYLFSQVSRLCSIRSCQSETSNNINVEISGLYPVSDWIQQIAASL